MNKLNLDGSVPKKPGPKPRQTSQLGAAEAHAVNSHRTDDHSDHGRLVPMRGEERIPIGQQRILDGLEKHVKPGFKGHCFLEKNVEGAFQGGYELVRKNDGAEVCVVKGHEKLFLMQIPQDLWDQDQRAKADAAIDMMRQNASIKASNREYDPHNLQNKGDAFSVKNEGKGNIDPLDL